MNVNDKCKEIVVPYCCGVETCFVAEMKSGKQVHWCEVCGTLIYSKENDIVCECFEPLQKRRIVLDENRN